MALSYDEISEIFKIIDESSCDEFVLETGDIKLVVRRRESEPGAEEDDDAGEGEGTSTARLEAARGEESGPPEAGRAPLAARNPGGPRRRLRSPEGGGRQPLDPILELKRAYHDFRQKKP